MQIILSPIFTNFFSGRIWMGLDYNIIQLELETKYKLQVRIINFENLIDFLENIPLNSALFFSSIYNTQYLQYIKDTIEYISIKRPDVILIPNKHQLSSLENKGYQELYKDLLGIEKVIGKYYGDIDELISSKKLEFPFVLKRLNGALSSGVQLMKNKKELEDFRQKVKEKSIKEKFAFLLNKRNSFNKDSNLAPVHHLLEKNFNDFFATRFPVVVQDFVPELKCDYKVLVFGDKYFVVKREVRDNDFRASGSGKLNWIVPPKEVLNFATILKKKFRVPFVSLDIGMDKSNNCYLFEYQGTAFGPATITAGDKYFFQENGEWKQNSGKYILEEEYAYAINHFLHENP